MQMPVSGPSVNWSDRMATKKHEKTTSRAPLLYKGSSRRLCFSCTIEGP